MQAVALLFDLHAHALEDFLNRQTGRAHVRQKLLCIKPVLSFPVAGRLSGRSRVSDKRPGGRVDLCKTLRAAAETARERIVAAGIKYDYVETVLRKAHLFQHRAQIQTFQHQIAFGFNLRADGNQEVAATRLHSVTGVVKETYGAVLNLAAELAYSRTHLC